jgi:hypothetical protein
MRMHCRELFTNPYLYLYYHNIDISAYLYLHPHNQDIPIYLYLHLHDLNVHPATIGHDMEKILGRGLKSSHSLVGCK